MNILPIAFYGYGLGYYGLYFDPTYILVIIGAAICLLASAKVNTTFSKYNKVRSMSGMTGRDAAQRILSMAGITDVSIQRTNGKLTDHYDPRNKTLNLSDSVYQSTSVAAIAVAAHEVGHAIQHQHDYFPLRLRSSLVPVANLGSTIAWPFIILGLFITSSTGTLLINLGIILFSFAVLFQIVTLPVEFNASSRALQMLTRTNMLSDEELRSSRKVLTAAALTYVASAAAIILQLLRLLILTGGRRDD